MSTPLLWNPGAGRGKYARMLERLVRGRDLELVEATGAENARCVSATLAARYPRVIVAGGDGTVHHAVRGLAGTETTLGILPTGTGNDFARALGVPKQLEAALERALRAEPIRVDLGRAGSTPFVGIAGVGIVADVLGFLDDFTRRYRGNWVYPWAVLRTVLSYRPLELSVETPNESFEGPAMIALAANAPRFGGGMRAAPNASLRDGLLDVVILRGTSRVGLVGLLPRVYRGTHLSDPRCVTFRASRIRLASDPGTVVYADGEAMPVETGDGIDVRVEPGALRVAV